MPEKIYIPLWKEFLQLAGSAAIFAVFITWDSSGSWATWGWEADPPKKIGNFEVDTAAKYMMIVVFIIVCTFMNNRFYDLNGLWYNNLTDGKNSETKPEAAALHVFADAGDTMRGAFHMLYIVAGFDFLVINAVARIATTWYIFWFDASKAMEFTNNGNPDAQAKKPLVDSSAIHTSNQLDFAF